MTRELNFPTLYQTAPHPCPYLHQNTSINLIIDPDYDVDQPMYDRLLEHGFRRNGNLYYRPFCNDCFECRSVRIEVKAFNASRGQRRIKRRNADLKIEIQPTAFVEEQFRLYLRYQAGRHAGDSMDDPDPEKYHRFLIESRVHSFSILFRLNDDLIAVAIVDKLNNGLSAVYTFFDPQHSKRSLGTYAILSQVAMANNLNLDWVYLGYWIKSSRKMSYKVNFQPLQQFDTRNSRWRPCTAPSSE